MSFDSFADFVAMGGHGLFVWAAYGITLVVIVINLWWPGMVRRGFIQSEKRALQRRTAETPSTNLPGDA